MTDLRKDFEEMITAPPFERDVTRNPDDNTSAWPGAYSDYHVHLAWDVWQAAYQKYSNELPNHT